MTYSLNELADAAALPMPTLQIIIEVGLVRKMSEYDEKAFDALRIIVALIEAGHSLREVETAVRASEIDPLAVLSLRQRALSERRANLEIDLFLLRELREAVQAGSPPN